jgi:hypothetical protein
MKSLFSIILFLILVVFSFGQGSITKSLKDFGAKGDGVSDDMPAFLQASQFFNDRKGNGTLTIPSGIYMVNTQMVNPIKGGTYYKKTQCLEFEGCENLKIFGKGKVLIKYMAGQR